MHRQLVEPTPRRNRQRVLNEHIVYLSDLLAVEINIGKRIDAVKCQHTVLAIGRKSCDIPQMSVFQRLCQQRILTEIQVGDQPSRLHIELKVTGHTPRDLHKVGLCQLCLRAKRVGKGLTVLVFRNIQIPFAVQRASFFVFHIHSPHASKNTFSSAAQSA